MGTSFLDFFISRSVTTVLLMVAILVIGFASYFALPVSNLPAIDYPTIQITASLPGANPDVMASSVASPLEAEFTTIAGVESMTSSSSVSSTSIILRFVLSRNIDAAAQDVQAAISRAARNLPSSMSEMPSFTKVNPAEQPIMYLAITSDTLDLAAVDKFTESLVARRISMIAGVARVQLWGEKRFAVRVQADPDKMASYRIDLEQLRDALRSGSVVIPAGSVRSASKAYTIEGKTQLETASQFSNLIIKYHNGAPVRLSQISNVLDSVSDLRSSFWVDDRLSMLMAIQKIPGANTVEVANAVKALLPTVRHSIPQGLKIRVAFDDSINVRESIKDVKTTLIITIVLVVIVIFLFIRNVSATLIPSLVIPVSILGTFGVMRLFGFSVDIFSMMAITLSVGFVVDDAIVMLENVIRHVEMGKNRFQAARDGSREVAFTIVSMTVSLVAVFIPVLFLNDAIGRLLREFAITISAAVLLSGIVSLTLTPWLCSRFLQTSTNNNDHHSAALTNSLFVRLHAAYITSLSTLLRHKGIVLTLTCVLTIVSITLFITVPKAFMPPLDQGFVSGGIEASPDTSFERMTQIQEKVNAIVRTNPWVKTFGSGTPFYGENTGFLFMSFKEGRGRPSSQQLISAIQVQLSGIPDITTFLQLPAVIDLGQAETRARYSFALQGADDVELIRWARVFEVRLRELKEITDLTSDLKLGAPRLELHVKRDRALALGVTPEQIANTLYDAFGNRKVGTITSSSSQYDLLLELLPKFQRSSESILGLHLRTSSGSMAPFSEIASLSQSVAPLAVKHIGQLPAVTFQFNEGAGVSLDSATHAIVLASQQIGMPDTIGFTFQGTAAAFQHSLRSLGLLLLIAVMVIYLILGVLYESFLHPITILSGLPSACVGALLTLLLFKDTLNLYSFVGVLLLIGVVKKNAIMVVDFALVAQRYRGKTPIDAVVEGCSQRFRPIIMTTVATLFGTLPIALGTGAAGEARRPLGIAVIGGLLVSQVFTLYITPVMFVALSRIGRNRQTSVSPQSQL